jgi:hypothetical protein
MSAAAIHFEVGYKLMAQNEEQPLWDASFKPSVLLAL